MWGKLKFSGSLMLQNLGFATVWIGDAPYKRGHSTGEIRLVDGLRMPRTSEDTPLPNAVGAHAGLMPPYRRGHSRLMALMMWRWWDAPIQARTLLSPTLMCSTVHQGRVPPIRLRGLAGV